ncbi:MAG TPA: prepilin-type N-terminal cleavage/methylation domain-containing protein [Gemmatimonadaceae bacterium]|nr:prepilin-type N-terminal cleavage/methylation domain-containing protein [Gemmatimonadaceae bacterium]
MQDSGMANGKGLTLIEIVIVIAIAGLLSAITISRAGGFIDRIAVHGATMEAESMFSRARHIAIAQAKPTILEIDPVKGTLSIRGSTDVLSSRDLRSAHGVDIDTNRTSITYSPIGIGYGAANFTMVLSRGRAADTIYVSRLGRVRH